MKRDSQALQTLALPAWPVPKGTVFPRHPSPHVDLANLGYNPESEDTPATSKELEMFFKRYGIPQEAVSRLVPNAQDWQLRLRGAWRHKDVRLFIQGRDAFVGLTTGFTKWSGGVAIAKAGMVVLRVKNIFDYMSFLLARDLNRLRICAKADCCTPFFVASGRADKKTCSDDCRFSLSKRNLRKGGKKGRRKRRRSHEKKA